MYAEWLPEDVAPDAFDLEEINAALEDANVLAELPPVHPALAQLVENADPVTARELVALITLAAGAEPDPTPEELAAPLRPWRTMLEVAGGDGIRLTAAGWMEPAACERLWHEGGLGWDFGKGNREQNTPELTILREECTRAGLIRRHKGRLVLARPGRHAATNPHALARAVASGLTEAKEPVDQAVRVLTLLLVAARWRPGTLHPVADNPLPDRFALGDEVARLLAGAGWEVSGPGELRYAVGHADTVLTLLAAGYPDLHRGALPDAGAVRALARMAIFGT